MDIFEVMEEYGIDEASLLEHFNVWFDSDTLEDCIEDFLTDNDLK